MRYSTLLALLGLTVGGGGILGCASSSMKTSLQGTSLIPDNAPTWVAQGSRVKNGAIFGVGSVSGIANAPVAQQAARDRGRAEISRILEVYSVSLMKDYQASTSAGGEASDEAQAVEQAVKTYSANLLSGSEQRNMWLDRESNTWFALMMLDFERSKTAAAQSAQMGGRLRAWVDKNGDRVLSELEADTERTRPRPTPPGPAPSPRAKPEPPSVVAVEEAGPRPPWVNGNCDRTRYLCGVAQGPSANASDTRARAALALIFKANIKAVSDSFQSAAREASSRTGQQWREVERVSDHSMVTTDKVVPMSEILARWNDGGSTWSLAVVDRAKASRALRERIGVLDRAINDRLAEARAKISDMDRIPLLRRTLGTLGEREAVNADLQVLSQDGRGVSAPVSWQDVLALLQGAAARLRFGLALAGPGSSRVQACLEEALLQADHELMASEVREDTQVVPRLNGTFDVRVDGQLRTVSMGRISGAEVVQTNLTLRLVNARSGRTLRTVSGSEKATRPTQEAAAATAAYKVCKKKVPSMIKDINRYFGR